MKEVIAFWDKPEMLNKQEVTLLHFKFTFSTLIKEKMFTNTHQLDFQQCYFMRFAANQQYITIRSILDLEENFCDFERLLSEISEYIMLGDL